MKDNETTRGESGESRGETDGTRTGERLLHAVERILESPEAIKKLVERKQAHTGAWDTPDVVAPLIISHYSNRAAVVGGATALPAMMPGIGTAVALMAGPLVDMVALLKLECEMCLALSALRGNDITLETERQLALLLAAVQVTKATGNRHVLADAAHVTSTAIWNYTPRRVGKLLVKVFALLAAAHISKSLFKAIPVIGVAIGASLNKVLTSRVGRQAYTSLQARDKQRAAQPKVES